MRFGLLGAIPSAERRTEALFALVLWLGPSAPLMQACNVYTPDMLVVAVGGMSSSAGQSTRGGAASGGDANGGTAAGGTQTTGGGGTTEMGGRPEGGTSSSTGGAPFPTGGTASGGSTSAGGATTSIVTSGTSAGGVGTGGVATGGVATGGVVSSGGSALASGGTAGGTATSTASGGNAAAGQTSATGGSAAGGAAPCDPTIVDDMRDSGAAILVCDNRNGSWYSYGKDPTLLPAVGSTFTKTAITNPTDQTAIGAKFAAVLQGSSTPGGTDCGMGFPLRDQRGTKYAYSLAGASLSFKYRTTGITADGILWLSVPITTTTPASEGGTCTGVCSNHYAYRLSPSTTWKQVTVALTAGSGGFTQDTSWGANLVDWDPTKVLFIQFAVRGQSSPYTLSVGPIALVR